MPLSEEQVAALGLLATADPEEVAVEVKKKANPLWTHIFNAGHKKATALADKAVEDAEKARDAAQEEARQAKEAADKASKGNPDVETVRNEAKAEAARLKKEKEDREKELLRQIEDMRVDGILKDFASIAASDEFGIRDAWLRQIRNDPELRKRVVPSKEDPEGFDLLQRGKEIPLQSENDTREGKLKALAAEYREHFKKTDPDAIRAARNDDGTGNRITPPESSKAGEYDPVKDGEQRGKQAAGAAADPNWAGWR